MRAISTVLDVAVFLLLVSAAVGTVAYAPQPVESGPPVEDTADLVATTTATVDYDIRQQSRRAHGTLATLVARAAVANTTLDGVGVTAVTGDFGTAVRRRVRSVLRAPNRTSVTAVWRPYRGAPIEGRFAVGGSPPPNVDVSVATLSVPSPVSRTETRPARRTAGYRSLAGQVADSTAEVLLPSTATAAAFGQSSPTAVASISRYRAMADALDVPLESSLSQGEVAEAYAAVRAALVQRLAGDMQRRFDSPAAVRDALGTGTVTIAVRRWVP